MIIAPLAALSARDPRAVGDMVPTVRPMVDGVEQQSLVRRISTQVRRIEQDIERLESGLRVAIPALAAGIEQSPKSEQALRGDCGRRTVDRLVIVEGISPSRLPVAEGGEARCARVPVGNAVGRGRG